MRSSLAIASLFVVALLRAGAQQNGPTTSPAETGVTAPVLLPYTATITAPKHCDALDGTVKLAATINSAGLPQTLRALEASDRRLISFATQIIEAQKFQPGAVDGVAKAVDVELTVGVHACAQRTKEAREGNFYQFTLRAHPFIALALATSPATHETASATSSEGVAAEQVGGHISAPVPTVLTDPMIPVSGKLEKRGYCVLGITVDASGIPQNIRLVRKLDPELDSNAMEAVKNWRFTPALRDGSVPVAVEGTAVAIFEYVEKKPVTFASFFAEAPEKVLAANAHDRTHLYTLEAINADEVIARYKPQSRISGRVLVSLIVDANGVPRNVHVLKGLDSSLDMDTVAMVEHLRFKPAMNDVTTPVPVGIVLPLHYSTTVAGPAWKSLLENSLRLAIFIWVL